MIKCIAIDDEPLALRQLRTYIAHAFPFWNLRANTATRSKPPARSKNSPWI